MPSKPLVPIIGGGPAGMSCALWLHNFGLRPIIVERESALGGMARRSPYPNEGLLGRPNETARENAAAFERHVRRASIEAWTSASPRQMQRTGDGRFRLDVELGAADPSPSKATRSLAASAVVIATGTRFRGEEWLDAVENARPMASEGRVHVGASWAGEPATDVGSHVAVVGGGDNAFDVSRMLVERGVRVTVIMRAQKARAQPLMVQRLRQHEGSGKARVLAPRTVRALAHSGCGLRLLLDDGQSVEADHVLLLLGYQPNSDAGWIEKLALRRDSRGYLIVDGNMETSCCGVFAVGDVANPAHPCIATAVGSGTMAAREIAKRFLR